MIGVRCNSRKEKVIAPVVLGNLGLSGQAKAAAEAEVIWSDDK